MKELAINTKRQDCIDELKRDRVRVDQRGATPVLDFSVQLPNLRTTVEINMEDDGEESSCLFLRSP